MSSQFDPDTFLNTQVEGDMPTKFEPCPEGEWKGIIEKVEGNTVGQNNSPVLQVTYLLDEPELAQREGREQIRVRQTVFLDLTENGTLDLGPNKNVQLGRLRAALGQNDPSKPWSPRMMEGQGPVYLRVEHQPSKEGDAVYDRVTRVAGAPSQ